MVLGREPGVGGADGLAMYPQDRDASRSVNRETQECVDPPGRPRMHLPGTEGKRDR